MNNNINVRIYFPLDLRVRCSKFTHLFIYISIYNIAYAYGFTKFLIFFCVLFRRKYALHLLFLYLRLFIYVSIC